MNMTARIEDDYLAELVTKVAEGLKIKSNASLLCLGGGQWRFGNIVATQLQARNYIYADCDEDEIKMADDSEILTTQCDPSNIEQLTNVGKYDCVIMKEVLEFISPSIESWEEFFFALYKVLKLKGTVCFISRLQPTIPIPDATQQKWAESVPTVETLCREATECGFECNAERVSFKTSIDKQSWKEALVKGKCVPFLDVSSKDDIAKCVDDSAQDIVDEVDLIFMKKVIR